jgi:hypothetical protein
MEAEAVFAQRAGETSRNRLAIYVSILERVASLLEPAKIDEILAFRNDLTLWSPQIVDLPIWQTIYKLGASADYAAVLKSKLSDSIDALNEVLEHRAGAVPADLVGDVSQEVATYLKATA